MNQTDIKVMSDMFCINEIIVRSRYLKGEFTDVATGIDFFRKNIAIIKSQPFVKWVGGKRQLIAQSETLISKEFTNYFEPFLRMMRKPVFYGKK